MEFFYRYKCILRSSFFNMKSTWTGLRNKNRRSRMMMEREKRRDLRGGRGEKLRWRILKICQLRFAACCYFCTCVGGEGESSGHRCMLFCGQHFNVVQRTDNWAFRMGVGFLWYEVYFLRFYNAFGCVALDVMVFILD